MKNTSTPQIECRDVGKLVPYANNSRTHSDTQIYQLASSIDEWGMVGAIIVRDGTIAKGHGTLMAIKTLYDAGKQLYPAPGKSAGAKPYPKNTAPVIDASGWTDAQFKAYVIADNKLALNAGWDDALLKVEFEELDTAGFDVTLTGFTLDEIETITVTEPPKSSENTENGENGEPTHTCPKCGHPFND